MGEETDLSEAVTVSLAVVTAIGHVGGIGLRKAEGDRMHEKAARHANAR